MANLGELYALTEVEVEKLRSLPPEQRYSYMLEDIEERLLDTSRECELNKGWEGIHYCLGGGQWNENNEVPANIILGGEFLVKTDGEIITLKNHHDVEEIVAYLQQNNLQDIIKNNFFNIVDENLRHKGDNGLEMALSWSWDILSFYENALKENHQVIFTVDF